MTAQGWILSIHTYYIFMFYRAEIYYQTLNVHSIIQSEKYDVSLQQFVSFICLSLADEDFVWVPWRSPELVPWGGCGHDI